MLIELTHMVDTCDFAKENSDSTKKTGKKNGNGMVPLRYSTVDCVLSVSVLKC